MAKHNITTDIEGLEAYAKRKAANAVADKCYEVGLQKAHDLRGRGIAPGTRVRVGIAGNQVIESAVFRGFIEQEVQPHTILGVAIAFDGRSIYLDWGDIIEIEPR